MWNKLLIALLGLVFATVLPRPALAETVMEKVARTGILTVGSRTDTVPYAYVNDKQELVGYSVDVLELIKKEVQERVGGREVTLQLREITDVKDVIPAMRSGDIDIACNTQFTWERDEYVDFSIAYSLSGIRLLTKTGSPISGTPVSLVDKRIGVVRDTLGESIIKSIQPRAKVVYFKGADDLLSALKQGTIDAIAGDTVILAGNAVKDDPKAYQLVPTEPYARYGVACMIPEDNSTFQNAVNQSIAKMIQGYVDGDKKYVEMVNKWVGPEGIVPIPEELIRGYFRTVQLSREQISLTEPPIKATTETPQEK
jgi:polar amino acid transport system substrate-binding protein